MTKVTACATVVATRALTNLKQISKSGLSEKDEERLSFVIKDLTLQKTGLEHELNIVKIVEKRGFSFIKYFEANNDLPKEDQRRMDFAAQQKRLEEKEKPKKSEPTQNVQRGGFRGRGGRGAFRGGFRQDKAPPPADESDQPKKMF